MKYCDLHTPDSLQDEEGDGCPLCESMIDKNERLTRWAATNKHQKAQLAAQAALLDDCLEVVRDYPRVAIVIERFGKITCFACAMFAETESKIVHLTGCKVTKAAALVKRLEAYKEVDDE